MGCKIGILFVAGFHTSASTDKQTIMIRNYFKTAWRNLMKNKIFSIINIAGLSVGMAACLLVLQYVSFELSYDQFNKNAGDIYRVYNDRYQNGKLIQHTTKTYSAIGESRLRKPI